MLNSEQIHGNSNKITIDEYGAQDRLNIPSAIWLWGKRKEEWDDWSIPGLGKKEIAMDTRKATHSVHCKNSTVKMEQILNK